MSLLFNVHLKFKNKIDRITITYYYSQNSQNSQNISGRFLCSIVNYTDQLYNAFEYYDSDQQYSNLRRSYIMQNVNLSITSTASII